MVENVNKKIIEKIQASDLDESVKKFIIELLRLEFQHIEEGKWKFGDEYERLIKHYSEKFEAIK